MRKERLCSERMEELTEREALHSERRRSSSSNSHTQTEWTYESLERREARLEMQRLAVLERQRELDETAESRTAVAVSQRLNQDMFYPSQVP